MTAAPYLAPVPDSEPPFDDELDPLGSHAVHGPRPVSFRPASAQHRKPDRSTPIAQSPAGAETPQARPITIKATGVPSWSWESDIGVVRTASVNLPPVQRAASVLARAVIEVLAGHRPIAQLRVHCSPGVYAGLGDRATVVTRSLPHLLSVRVCEPADGVTEVSAVFRRADRVRALAFRLEGVDGRWRITALQLG